ncbi:hypothetical protein TWF173_005138 [Orbilia oligospora]|nr:hypothetical protein TWF173_005138 [Orbilia oligospora]
MGSKWDLDLAFPDSPTDEYSMGSNGNLAYRFPTHAQQSGEILAQIAETQLPQRLPHSPRTTLEEEISGGSGELVGCIIINASSKKICLFLEDTSDLIDSEERLSIPKCRQAPSEGIKQAAIRAGEMTGNKCYLLPIGGDEISAYSGFYVHPKDMGAIAAESSAPPAGQQFEGIRWFIAAIDEKRQMIKTREEMKARRRSKVQEPRRHIWVRYQSVLNRLSDTDRDALKAAIDATRLDWPILLDGRRVN